MPAPMTIWSSLLILMNCWRGFGHSCGGVSQAAARAFCLSTLGWGPRRPRRARGGARAARRLRSAGSGMTLRARLTLWYAAVLAGVLVLFGGAVYVILSVSMTRQIEQNLGRTGGG